MTGLYALVLALSAFLVFWIQPLVARMLLPVLGGTPSVWNTCVMFFQGMLLLGYLYSHGLTRRLSVRAQGIVHLAVLLLAVVVLPTGPGVWAPPEQGSQVLWLLGRLLLYVGLPYVVLSSTAPLLQYWFGEANRRRSRDPYFLYAASNAGSLLALLAFPVVLEPRFRMSEQTTFWHHGFLLLALLVLVCFGLLLRVARLPPVDGTAPGGDPAQGIDRRQARGSLAAGGANTASVARWLAYSFVPSSLMLGVTTHVTTDIAAVSFLWVLPLAMYLATFILAFSEWGGRAEAAARFLLPFLVVFSLMVMIREDVRSLLLVPLELTIVGCISMVFHRRLYESRPQLSKLTAFYLWVSFGGFLGGLLNGLLAPVLFNGIAEYPLVLVLGFLVVEWNMLQKIVKVWHSAEWHGFKRGEVALVAALVLVLSWWAAGPGDPKRLTLVVCLVLTAMLAGTYALGARLAGRFVVVLCFLLYLGSALSTALDRGIYAGRSFFGAFAVDDTEESGVEMRIFSHGTTVHGIQARDPELALSVRSYYATVADIFSRYLEERGPSKVGVTGLGAGNLACLGRRGDHFTFFEIDPAVERVAREFFTYLDRCQPSVDVILGDARLKLEAIEDGR